MLCLPKEDRETILKYFQDLEDGVVLHITGGTFLGPLEDTNEVLAIKLTMLQSRLEEKARERRAYDGPKDDT